MGSRSQVYFDILVIGLHPNNVCYLYEGDFRAIPNTWFSQELFGLRLFQVL
jgi:hypothetical protein